MLVFSMEVSVGVERVSGNMATSMTQNVIWFVKKIQITCVALIGETVFTTWVPTRVMHAHYHQKIALHAVDMIRGMYVIKLVLMIKR